MSTTATTLPSPLAPGDILAGKYRLEEQIGAGGMGVVFAATHLELDQRVAIKFLLESASSHDSLTAKRFAREARAAVKLRSEHVVRVFDVGTHEKSNGGDCPYIVMELLIGHELDTQYVARERLGVQEVIGLMMQVLSGIAEAHALAIVHRDLKPANLFVTKRRDGSRCVKILDFGVAKRSAVEADSGASAEASAGAGAAVSPARSSQLTSTAALVGSPMFMSPEQWLSTKDIDARADIWAVGAILYRLLARRSPFDGSSVAQLCTAVLHSQPVPIREHRPDLELPLGLEEVIFRCLAKEPRDRYADVGELAHALEAFAPPKSLRAGSDAASIRATVRSSSLSASGTSSAAAETAEAASEEIIDALDAGEATPTTTQAASLAVRPRADKTRSWLWLLAATLSVASIGAATIAITTARAPTPASTNPPPAPTPSHVLQETARTAPALATTAAVPSTAIVAARSVALAGRSPSPSRTSPSPAPSSTAAETSTTFDRSALGGRH